MDLVFVCTQLSTWKSLSQQLAATGAKSMNSANKNNSADIANGVNWRGTGGLAICFRYTPVLIKMLALYVLQTMDSLHLHVKCSSYIKTLHFNSAVVNV